MPFIFNDSQERVYINLTDAEGHTLLAVPGVTVLDQDPGDGRWIDQAAPVTPQATPEAPQTAPEAPVEPATPETTPTPSN